MQTTEDIEKKVTELKNNITVLSSKLRELGAEKENKYKENSILTNKLNLLIKEANELKQSKKDIDDDIRKHKEKREKYNKEVSELASQLRKFRNEGKAKLPKGHIPSEKIKKNVDELNTRIETEAMAFEKEQALNKQIKDYKLKYKEALKAEESIHILLEIRKQLNEKKKVSDEAHKSVQRFAKQNTDLFKNLTEKSLSISSFKKQKVSLRNILTSLKQNIYETNEELASKLAEWSEYKKSASEKRIQAEATRLVAKTRAIKDKLKSKEKLTTEDILLLQRESMRRK